jgi:MFS family permease
VTSEGDVDEREEATDGLWSPNYLAVTLANLTVVAIAAFDGLALVAALAVAGIAAGPVIDAIGVRRTFRATGLWFLASSALAAAAPNMELLVAARALQGIGGGLVISVALASVGLAYPNRLRPRAFAAVSMVWGVMGFGGPVGTAGLLAIAGWRMIFIVQLPITALALVAGWNRLPSTRERPQRIVMDGRGIALIAALVAASLLAVSQIGVRWWLCGAAAAAVIAVAASFWAHIGRSDQPLVERQHITRFPLKRVHITSGLVLVTGLAADNYLPLYMQTTRGSSEAFAAFSVIFLTVGWTAAAFFVSRLLDRFHESQTILFGACLMPVAVAIAGIGIALTWPLALVFSGFFLMGTSIGFVSTSGLNLLQSSAADTEMGRVNSAHQFIRTLSITYGVAIGGAILLFVVDRQTGDVEAVRDVLRGDDAVTSTQTLDAVRDGLASVHIFSGVTALGCLAAAIVLRRLVRARSAQGTPATAGAPSTDSA